MDGPGFGYTTAGGFEPHYHNHGGPDGAIIDGVRVEAESEYEPDEVVVSVRTTSTTSIGANSYYWLPETEGDANTNNVPFLGFGLEELNPSDWAGGIVTITLLSKTGPGDFRLWQDDGFGGAVDFIDTDNSISSFNLAAGSHTHFNWGFTELGQYELEWQISGNHSVDGVQSASALYVYAVPVPSSALLALGGILLFFRRRR